MDKIDSDKIRASISAIADHYDADVIGYVGLLMQPDDETVISICRERIRKRKNVLLILSTPGGSADTAYRIARSLQAAYQTKSDKIDQRGSFILYVHDMCTSAGTLLSLGANRVILSQKAQLGPIDVQLRKDDEVGERRSGLAPREALETLSGEAGKTFFRLFRLMRSGLGMQLPTKLAAETAARMSVGILEPIYSQLDPLRLGEMERFVRIAQEYGNRLRSPNVREGTIERLLSDYPSHEFVIDREEARELFERVDVPSDDLELVAESFISFHHPSGDNLTSYIQFLNVEPDSKPEANDVEAEGTDVGQIGARTRPAVRQERPASAGDENRIGEGTSSGGSGVLGQAAE